MKVYEVEFDYGFTYKDYLAISELHTLSLNWEKSSNYDGYKSTNSSSTDAEKAEQEEIKLFWDTLSIEKAMEQQPHNVNLRYSDRRCVLNLKQLEAAHKYIKILNVVEVDTDVLPSVDLDKLASKIAANLGTSLPSSSQSLTVNQPQMPLFLYNQFIELEDANADSLQKQVDLGYRVVAVIEMPHNTYPNYILAKHITKE